MTSVKSITRSKITGIINHFTDHTKQNTAPVNESATALAAAIGVRVKHERQSCGWTLDQLAEVARVSCRMVVNVEQGAANPSVKTLLRLNDAHGAGLPALIEPPQPKPVKVTCHGDSGAAAFPGDVPHSYANLDTRPASFSLAAFEPGVGLGSQSVVSNA